jgi:RNA polymerase sigma factor (sigma-70 family)
MANAGIKGVVGRARRAAARAEAAALTDGQLLARFVADRDEAAFAELVARLGPAVFAACCRVLGDHHAAEDAFQAVFVVLAKKAHTVRPRAAVAGWVYGVARKAALEAYAVMRRRHRETLVAAVPDSPATPDGDRIEPDVLAALDAEIAGLSGPYRSAVVPCELRGTPRKAAARQLGIPEGTLSSRLAVARKLLAARLRARGVALSAAALSAGLAAAGRAAVPLGLPGAAVRAAVSGRVPGGVSTITQEVLRSMYAGKLKLVSAGLLLAAGLAVGLSSVMPGPEAATATAAPLPFRPPRGGRIWLWEPPGQISTIDADGGGRRRVELKEEGRVLRWVSPEHNLVWFDGKDGHPFDGVEARLHVRPLNDKTAKATDLGVFSRDVLYISRDGRTAFARVGAEWSPDGGTVYTHYTLVDAVTKTRAPFKFPAGGPAVGGSFFVQDLAPDGTWVLAFENTDSHPDRAKQNLPQARLHKLPRDGGKPVLLTGRLNAWDGRLSPDGKRLLAHAHARVAGAKPEWQGSMYVIDVATQKATKISGPENQAWAEGVWSPDGRSVAYAWGEQFEAGKTRVVVCDADGKNARVILTTEKRVFPLAWR